MKQNKKGFTLIELLVVIVIIGIVISVVIVTIQGPRKQAQDKKNLAHLRQVASLLEQYYIDNKGTYNTSTSVVSWSILTYRLGNYSKAISFVGYNYRVYIRSGVTAPQNQYCLSIVSAVDNTKYIRCEEGARCVANALNQCNSTYP